MLLVWFNLHPLLLTLFSVLPYSLSSSNMFLLSISRSYWATFFIFKIQSLIILSKVGFLHYYHRITYQVLILYMYIYYNIYITHIYVYPNTCVYSICMLHIYIYTYIICTCNITELCILGVFPYISVRCKPHRGMDGPCLPYHSP